MKYRMDMLRLLITSTYCIRCQNMESEANYIHSHLKN
jgi:hypothetical protein